jgi:bacillopeptidase F (M6 metalloprotease family)
MSGSLVRSSAAFTNAAGAATDPTSVVLKYRSGAGSTTTVTYPSSPVTKDSTGNYHADFDTTGWAGPDALLYVTEWTGTGTVQAIASDAWLVTPPAL